MLDVLHCVLIDSPEALNMMRVSGDDETNTTCKSLIMSDILVLGFNIAKIKI